MDIEAFFLGTHRGKWLWETDIPLCVKYQQIINTRNKQPATCLWFLDSGAYSELDHYGEWTISVDEYCDGVLSIISQVGVPVAIAPQDWMCEPHIIAKTGLSVDEHLKRTVASFFEARERLPDLPVVPVLQGFSIADYVKCVDLYEAEGIHLEDQYMVGLGSVCRRQSTEEIGEIVRELASYGIRLHGFGVKKQGLTKYGNYLLSSDSAAWSFYGRMHPELAGDYDCDQHQNCANCLAFAKIWRQNLLDEMEGYDVPTFRNYLYCAPLDRDNSGSTVCVSDLPG